ncbi:MAG: hypothetical protein KDA53_12595 [Hyphomonas sp.]|nr:hypothetical protein [Hyphomonas sp.]
MARGETKKDRTYITFVTDGEEHKFDMDEFRAFVDERKRAKAAASAPGPHARLTAVLMDAWEAWYGNDTNLGQPGARMIDHFASAVAAAFPEIADTEPQEA